MVGGDPVSDEKPLSPSDIRRDQELVEQVRSGDDVAPLLSAMRDNARRPS